MSNQMTCEFIPIEDLRVGDRIASATVVAIRETAKRVYYTYKPDRGGELVEWPQAKGSRIAKFHNN